ncbi:MFS transporter [Lachnoclostridium phocaeense]|uniref:MFS transporter n=1 Tax=Lachnoclostridium phocaeense TaxID=1871021 RepID=UPI00248E6FD4|nr:MFS transporter [Lachnoclostridium phocaeense]
MKRSPNRWLILAAAAIVNFVHGNPYIWTVFQPYVKEEYGLSTAASSLPFTLIIGIFAAGNMAGGYLQHRLGARMTAFLGSLVMCAGFFLAAMAPRSMPWLISLGYGVLGGFGSGCAFAMLTAVPQAWFPERRGMVSGITIGMVGLSGILMNPLCDRLLASFGYRTAMLWVTFIYAALCLGIFFLREPEAAGIAPESGAAEIAGMAKTAGTGSLQAAPKQYTAREMMRTRSFYVISLVYALAVPAYALVNPVMKSLGMERGLTDSAALLGVVAASAANIAGRFALPWLSDRTGRRRVLGATYLLCTISALGLVFARGALFTVLSSAVCLVYGGVVSVFPVVVSDRFGTKYQGTNYGAAMIGYSIASLISPLLLSLAGQETSLAIAGLASAAGLFLLRFL